MIRRFLCAAMVLAAGFAMASAEEFKGKLTAINGDKITFAIKAKAKGEKPEIKTFDLARNVKVLKLEKKEKSELAEGLKAELLQNIDPKKGISAVITVEGDKVTSLAVSPPKKK